MAAAASSAPMMRTLSLDGRGPRGLSLSFRWSSVGRSLMCLRSDLEELVLLVLHHAVDLCHVVVCDLLELLLGAVELVGADLVVLLHPFELVAGSAPQVTDGDPSLLRLVLDHLHQLLPPLLGQ